MKINSFKNFVFLFLLVSCKKTDEGGIPIPFEKIDIRNTISVLSSRDNNLTIFNISDFSIKKTIAILTNSSEFANSFELFSNNKKALISLPSFDFSLDHSILHSISPKGKLAVLDFENNGVSSYISALIDLPIISKNAIFLTENNEIWTSLYSHSGKILVFNANNNEQKETIYCDSEPSQLLIAKNNSLVCFTSSESTFLNVIDTKTKKLTDQIKIDPNPETVVKGFDENSVFVINKNQKSINMVDLTQKKVTDNLDLSFIPSDVSYYLNEIWISEAENNKVHVFVNTSGKWLENQAISTGNYPIKIKFNGDKAYVICQKSNSLQVFYVKDKSLVKELKTGNNPVDFQIVN